MEPGKSGLGKASANEPRLAFVCPNGHRMNAPAHLQGKAGQCPVCGAKFVIPSPSDIAHGAAAGASDGSSLGSAPLAGTAAATTAESPAGSNHPLCNLLTTLWAEKEHGAIIELHLAGGSVLIADWFDEPNSRQTHGVFAAQSADGSVTMTIVAWESVSRVVVRNLEGLPEGMF